MTLIVHYELLLYPYVVACAWCQLLQYYTGLFCCSAIKVYNIMYILRLKPHHIALGSLITIDLQSYYQVKTGLAQV
jgi:hypothetical protein